MFTRFLKPPLPPHQQKQQQLAELPTTNNNTSKHSSHRFRWRKHHSEPTLRLPPSTVNEGPVEHTHKSKMASLVEGEGGIADGFCDEHSKSCGDTVVREDQDQSFASPVGGTALHPMRCRLDTEETHRIRNVMLSSPDTTIKPPVAMERMEDQQRLLDESYSELYMERIKPTEHDDMDDSASIVSSLTNDEDSLVYSRRHAMLPPIRELSHEISLECPPTEVAIPLSVSKPDLIQRTATESTSSASSCSRMEELIMNLSLQRGQSQPPSLTAVRSHESPEATTRGSSPFVIRPQMARNFSCPVRTDYSVASSSLRYGSSDASSIVVNGNVVEGLRNRDGDSWDMMNPNDSLLLGDRKRRVNRRGNTGTEISVGSIVGQSTLHTDPTSAGSFTDSEASSVRKALRSAASAEEMLHKYSGASDGIACCQARRPKNVVKEEIKYVMGQLTSPIRKIPLFKEKKADFQRAKGSLV